MRPSLVRIVGKHDGDVAFGWQLAAELHPVGGEISDEFDAVRHRLVSDDPALGALMPHGIGLEGDGAGVNAAIEFRQHHVHGEIAGAEALDVCMPLVFRSSGEDHLQHRAIILRKRIKTAG